jgi:hypothetical protein
MPPSLRRVVEGGEADAARNEHDCFRVVGGVGSLADSTVPPARQLRRSKGAHEGQALDRQHARGFRLYRVRDGGQGGRHQRRASRAGRPRRPVGILKSPKRAGPRSRYATGTFHHQKKRRLIYAASCTAHVFVVSDGNRWSPFQSDGNLPALGLFDKGYLTRTPTSLKTNRETLLAYSFNYPQRTGIHCDCPSSIIARKTVLIPDCGILAPKKLLSLVAIQTAGPHYPRQPVS